MVQRKFNLYLARTAVMLSGARRVAMLLAVMMLTTTAQTAWADSAFSGGDGSSGNPYKISNTADLNQLAADVNGGNGYNGKYFVLTADITYDGTENNFTLIGDNLHIFYGTFDGDGKTISGINTNKKTEYQGIFGFVDGTVKNLFVSNCSIVGVHTTGVIAGQIRNGTIENCRVENNVTLSGNIYVGGIVGYSHGGTIKGCTSAATITGTQSSGQNATLLGGVVGATSGNSLTDNIFTGTITGDLGEYIGAIVGQYKSGTLTNNLYTSTGFGGIGAAGSTTGADGEGATVFVLDWATQSNGNSEATAYIINDKAQLDLLAQRVKDGNDYSGKYFKLGADITYDYSTLGATESNYTAIGDNSHAFAGHFDGDNHTVSGIRIYKGGDTNDNKYQALFGKTSSSAEVKNVILADALIIGFDYTGGIVGNNNGTITDCHVLSGVTVRTVQDHVNYHGGIAGYNDHGTITGCTSAAALDFVGNAYTLYYVGGIVGYNQLGTVSQCIYLGNTLRCDYYIGAIVAYNNMATVENCYFTSTTIQGKNNTTILDNAESAVGYNREGAVSNCGLAHKVTLGEGITLGAAATEHGLLTVYGNVVAMGYNDGTSTTFYSKSGNVITLGNYSGTAPEGYTFGGYSAKDADNGDVTVTKTSGVYTFTMPAKDVTVSAILTAIPWSGSGASADDPYIIEYPSQLDLLAQRVNAGTNYQNTFFKLGADITYDNNTANNFTPIGKSNYPFYGTFDGDGKTISGININSSDAEYQGIFGYVDGTVKNLVVSNCSIVGRVSIGAIAGQLRRGTIENCRVGNDVTLSGHSYIGGIVGASEGGTIKGCTSAATITGTTSGGNNAEKLGGVAGATNNYGDNVIATLTDNIFTGTITGDLKGYIGAIVGQNSNSTLTNNLYTSTGFGGIGAEGSTTGADGAGARKALTISAATGVTITPTGDATTYDVSGITVYAGNKGMKYNNMLYAGATDAVKLTLNYSGTAPEAYVFGGYSDGSGNALTNTSGSSYTLTMPAADVTVSPAFAPDIATYWHADADHDGSTETKAYIITTTTGLNLLAAQVNGGNDYEGKFFKLDADITYDYTGLGAEESNYTAIGGIYDSNDRYFKGKFDGQNHTVSGIRIYKGGYYSADQNQGLFGMIDSPAEVKNVILADATITGYQFTGGIVGGISGGTVKNCHVLSNVTVRTVQNIVFEQGGIAGANNGTVTGCTSAAALTTAGDSSTGYVGSSPGSVGGIVGDNGGTVEDCLYLGTTLEGKSHVGAIVGYNSRSTSKVTNSYYTDTQIQGKGEYVGLNEPAIVLDNAASAVGDNDGTVTNCGLARKVTLGEGITLGAAATTYGPLTVYGNVVAMGYNDGTSTTLYSTSGSVISLGNYSGTVPEGYVFGGYSATNSGTIGGNATDGFTLTVPAADVTVSATLTPIVYNLTYNGVDGATFETANPTTYTIESAAITLNNPTRNGYVFAGWYDNENFTGDAITAIATGSTGDKTFYARWKIITAISVQNTSLELKVLDEVATGATLTNVVSSTAVTDENVTLTYTSSNSNVATVEGGNIKAIAAGTATITVSFAGNDKYVAAEKTISVTVSFKDASVSVSDGENEITSLNLYVDDTYTIVPTTTPEGLAVTYAADGSGVVSVDENGVVTALKAGTGTVTVSVGGDGVYAESSKTITVKVSKVPTAISLNEPPFGYNFNVLDEVNTGATLKAGASLTPVTDENITLTYTSSNSNVAKVEGGNIICLAAGTAIITVSFAGNDKYAAAEKTISVTVSLYDASVSVDNNAFDLLVGESQAIAATTTPVGLDVTYTADGSGVVSVDEDGVVTALKAGTGTVTVSVGGDGYYAASSKTVTVTVSSYEMANLFSGSNEWTSYVADRNLGVPAGLTAYIITALGAETATATPIDYIPQGEPVLLKRSDKTVNSYASYIYSGSASIPAGNLLKVASATSQPTAYKDFGLYQDAFVLIGSGTLAAGKVYLPAQQASQGRAASRTIVVDGQTTRIDDGPWSMDDGQTDEWYDLQGRRLYTVPTKKGVYIYNGKKVAIK